MTKSTRKNRAAKPSLSAKIMTIIRFVPALAIVTGSSALNAKFGFMQAAGMGTNAQIALAGIALAVDWLKPMIPAFISKMKDEGQGSMVWAGRVGFGLAITFSLTAAIGFSATMKGSTTGGQANKIEEWQQAKADKLVFQNQIIDLGATLKHHEFNLKIAKLKAKRTKSGKSVWSQMECKAKPGTPAYGRLSQTYCPQVTAWYGMVKKEEAKNILLAKIANLQDILAQGKPAEADPQAKVFSNLFNIDQSTISMMLVLLPAFVLEYFSAFSFVFTQGGNRRPTASKSAKTVKPRDLMELLNLRKDKNGQVFIIQKNVAADLGTSSATVSRKLSDMMIDQVILQKVSKTIDGQRGTLVTLA